MTDTDRLAALLHAEWDRRRGEWSEPDVPCDVCEESAARLIAEGVRVGDDREAMYRDMYRQAAEWITTVQMHYVLGPEATPEDVFAVASEGVRVGDDGLRAAAQAVVLAAKEMTPEIAALNRALAAPPAPRELDRDDV